MAEENDRWWLRPQLWIEGFAILNIGFLTFDIYLAHSVNQFRNHAEYIPLVFSASAPVFLLFALATRYRWPAVWKDLGYLVGWSAVLVGLTGVVLIWKVTFFMSAPCAVSLIRRLSLRRLHTPAWDFCSS